MTNFKSTSISAYISISKKVILEIADISAGISDDTNTSKISNIVVDNAKECTPPPQKFAK